MAGDAIRKVVSTLAPADPDVSHLEAQCAGEEAPEVHHTHGHFGWLFRLLLVPLPIIALVVGLVGLTYRRMSAGMAAPREASADVPLQDGLIQKDVELEEEELETGVGTGGRSGGWWSTLRMSESIHGHGATPRLMKVIIPLAFIVLVALLLTAQLYYTGIAINAEVTIAGQHKYVTVFDYTTLSFVREGFDGGEYVLAVGMGFLAGTWAWLKLLLLMWLYFAPPVVISHASRTSALEFLDYTAKWSLIDCFTTVYMVPIVSWHIDGPWGSGAAWVDGLLGLELTVNIYYGFFAFLLSQVLNTLLGQVVLKYNRDVVASLRHDIQVGLVPGHDDVSVSSGVSQLTTWFEEGADDPTTESLRVHLHTKFDNLLACFVHPRPGEKRSPVSPTGRVAILFLLLGCFALVITGLALAFIGVRDMGVTGTLLDLTPDFDSDRQFTVWNILDEFINTHRWDDPAPKKALHWIVGIFAVICAVVVPLCQFALLLGMWLIPMRLSHHKKVFFATECLASWSALDVMVGAAVILIPNVKGMMNYIIGDRLDILDNVLIRLQELGLSNTDRVLTDEGYFCSGAWFLLAGAIVSNICYITLSRANKAAIRDRENEAFRRWRHRADASSDQSSHSILSDAVDISSPIPIADDSIPLVE